MPFPIGKFEQGDGEEASYSADKEKQEWRRDLLNNLNTESRGKQKLKEIENVVDRVSIVASKELSHKIAELKKKINSEKNKKTSPDTYGLEKEIRGIIDNIK